MSKHAAVKFHRELNALLDRRTSRLRKIVDKGIKTKPKVFDKSRRRKVFEKLELLATECLVRDLFKTTFKAITDKKKYWRCTRSKGWSYMDKKKDFDDWFDRNIKYKNCIYIFWKGREAEYIGRTLKGKGRPQSHFERRWCNRITRIDVYPTSQASQTPQLECLAWHRFDPKKNKSKPSIPKWAKKCPMCAKLKQIKAEIEKVFALR